jgi:LmbE family N-acetylglucosaminyl deacetylase
VPYPVDAHPDHVAACAIAEAARFWAKFVKTDLRGAPHYPAKVYHFMAVHLRLHVKPSFVVDTTPDLATKIRAIMCYESQFVANQANAALPERLERYAEYWGSLVGARYGEPFFCREEIGVSSVTQLL